MTLTDYAKEVVVFTVDALIFAFSLQWHKENRRAQRALSGPILQDKAAIDDWLQANPGGVNWVVLQGYVEPFGAVIRSFNDKSVKGVVQRLKIKEFVTSRNTSGFWQDGERVIADSFNTVPFGLRVGRDLVHVESPLNAAYLTLQNVSSEFRQKNTNVFDYVWGFLVGTRHRGIQTTEDMLICGTKLTGMGTLIKDKNMTSNEGIVLQPHYLSDVTISELQKYTLSQVRWSTVLLVISSVAGIAIVTYTLRRLHREKKKKAEEEERRLRKFQRTRQRRSDELSCVICENPREVILLPCGHICLCYDCSNAIERKCPMCRATVESINEYFIT